MSSASRYFQAIWFPSRLRLSKLRPPSDLVDQVHVSGALSGACTGKGSQMANPRPTPKPGNLGPQTSLTRCTFPVLYPVLAPERGPEWQTHARRRNLGRVLR